MTTKTPTANQRERELLDLGVSPESITHSRRFRKVSTGYPRRVTEAYDGDFATAASDSDETVAAKVREWEIANGFEPRDWTAIGAEERDDAKPPRDTTQPAGDDETYEGGSIDAYLHFEDWLETTDHPEAEHLYEIVEHYLHHHTTFADIRILAVGYIVEEWVKAQNKEQEPSPTH